MVLLVAGKVGEVEGIRQILDTRRELLCPGGDEGRRRRDGVGGVEHRATFVDVLSQYSVSARHQPRLVEVVDTEIKDDAGAARPGLARGGTRAAVLEAHEDGRVRGS